MPHGAAFSGLSTIYSFSTKITKTGEKCGLELPSSSSSQQSKISHKVRVALPFHHTRRVVDSVDGHRLQRKVRARGYRRVIWKIESL